MKELLFATLVLGSAAALFACGDDDTSSPASTTTPDAGTSTSTTAVNGCTAYTDLTAQTATTITFPTGASPAQYSQPCIKVKVGTAITFSGSFSSHPLGPSGGDTPNPITAGSSGTSATFTATAVGTFGYHCGFHPTVMLGAIEVVN